MKKTAFTFIAIAILISSCKKDEVPCDCVTAGSNNNTVQSYSFSVTNWILSGSVWYYDYVSIPATTNMNGAVMVYQDLGAGDYLSLPYTTNDVETVFSFNTNTILEVAVLSASGNTAVSNPGTRNYKVVIIPPGQRRANPEIDYTNYLQVKTVFNLK